MCWKRIENHWLLTARKALLADSASRKKFCDLVGDSRLIKRLPGSSAGTSNYLVGDVELLRTFFRAALDIKILVTFFTGLEVVQFCKRMIFNKKFWLSCLWFADSGVTSNTTDQLWLLMDSLLNWVFGREKEGTSLRVKGQGNVKAISEVQSPKVHFSHYWIKIYLLYFEWTLMIDLASTACTEFWMEIRTAVQHLQIKL